MWWFYVMMFTFIFGVLVEIYAIYHWFPSPFEPFISGFWLLILVGAIREWEKAHEEAKESAFKRGQEYKEEQEESQ